MTTMKNWFLHCIKNRTVVQLLILLYLHISEAKSKCSTPAYLRDKWVFANETGTVLKIRKKSFVFKRLGHKTVRYKCLEAKGNTFMLRTRPDDNVTQGYVCLGFAYIKDTDYRVWRLNQRAEGHALMAPLDFSPQTSSLNPNIHNVCKGANTSSQYHIHRANRRCKFPPVLRFVWQTTISDALGLKFTKHDLFLVTMNRKTIKFHCEIRDKDYYILRATLARSIFEVFVTCFKFSNPPTNRPMRHLTIPIDITDLTMNIYGFNAKVSNYKEDQDGILCLHIEPLTEDPFYQFRISITNSGSLSFDHSVHDMISLIRHREEIRIHKQCDLIDSPGRPHFLYHLSSS